MEWRDANGRTQDSRGTESRSPSEALDDRDPLEDSTTQGGGGAGRPGRKKNPKCVLVSNRFWLLCSHAFVCFFGSSVAARRDQNRIGMPYPIITEMSGKSETVADVGGL
jgi:hypothetical protein